MSKLGASESLTTVTPGGNNGGSANGGGSGSGNGGGGGSALTTDNRQIQFSKETASGSELPGARLTLSTYTKDNNLYQIIISGESGGEDFSLSHTTVSWTSTDKMVILKNMPNGTYRLHEDCAPAGYDIASDIWFTMQNGVLCDMEGNPIPNGILVMVDSTLTDPGAPDNNPGYQEDKKVPNSKVKSPQTSEDHTILFVGAFAMILIVLIGAYLLLDLLREKKREAVRVTDRRRE